MSVAIRGNTKPDVLLIDVASFSGSVAFPAPLPARLEVADDWFVCAELVLPAINKHVFYILDLTSILNMLKTNFMCTFMYIKRELSQYIFMLL